MRPLIESPAPSGRILIVAALCCVCALVAAAPHAGTLSDQTRDPDAATRHDAAKQLAARLQTKSPADEAKSTREAAMTAVLSDDPIVRKTMIDGLVAAKLITPAAAARIPTLAALDAQIQTLVKAKPSDRGQFAMPTARRCTVETADARSATLECNGSKCKHPCMHVQTFVKLQAGTRWSVLDQRTTASDTGACGHCM